MSTQNKKGNKQTKTKNNKTNKQAALMATDWTKNLLSLVQKADSKTSILLVGSPCCLLLIS